MSRSAGANPSLAELRNLGPSSAAMLHAAGIRDVAALRELGSVLAFLRVRDAGLRPSLNLLWALEGALTETAWQVVARERRLELLLRLDASVKRP